MAVAFDAVGPSSAGQHAAAVASMTWNHTCGASATDLLVACALDDAGDAGFTLGAKYNTVAMTSLGVIHSNANTAGYLQVWRMASPPTGSALAVLITVTGGTVGQLSGGSVSFTGSTGAGTPQTASGASGGPTMSFTPTTTGGIVAAFACGAQALTTTGTFTSRFTGGAGTSNAAGWCAGETLASTGSAVTPAWSMSSDWWGLLAVELAGAPPGAPVVLASGTGAAQTAMTSPYSLLTGPFYPATAADLGGGSGSWGTPQYAEGGP